jgi:hypothetical protein
MKSFPAKTPGAKRFVAVVAFYSALFSIFFAPVLFSRRLLAPGDGRAVYLPSFLSPKTAWTDAFFSGFPFLADPQCMAWNPLAAVLCLLPHGWGWNPFVISTYIVAAVCAFYLVRDLTGSDFAALVGGTTYGMNGFLIVHLGHVAFVQAAAWLPLLLLAVARLRRGWSAAWFAGGAAAVALGVFGGHPQIVVYSLGLAAAYALFCGWGAVGPRYYLWVGAFIALGLALSAVQLLPAAELAARTPRVELSFDFFSQPAMSWRHLITLIFPCIYGGSPSSVYPHRGWQGASGWGMTGMAGYAGVLPLLLWGVAVAQPGRRREVWFWSAAAILAALAALGPNTPLAAAMFHLPLYRRFRIPTRHFLEFGMAVSVLAGFGAAALGEATHWRRRAVVGVLAVVVLAIFGGTMVFRSQLAEQFRAIGVEGWSVAPWRNAAVGVPLAVSACAAGVILAWGKLPRPWARAVLMAVLVADLSSLAWFCEWRFRTEPRSLLEAPTNFARYREELTAPRQRIFTYRGEAGTLDEGQPCVSAVWGLDNASGNNPLLLSDYMEFLNLDPAGLGRPSLPGGAANAALDLLAVRYAIGPSPQALGAQYVTLAGRTWWGQDMPIDLPRADAPAGMLLRVPDVTASEVDLVTMLVGAPAMLDGQEALRVVVETSDGREIPLSLRAGEHTSDWLWARPDVRPMMRHKQAKVFVDPARPPGAPGDLYVAALPIGDPAGVRVKRLRLEWAAAPGVRVIVPKVSLWDGVAGRGFAIHPFHEWVGADWRYIETVGGAEVYENLRARPRAWLAHDVARLPASGVLRAIQQGSLPDGRRFDPSTTALVSENDRELEEVHGGADLADEVRVTKAAGGSMTARVKTGSPGMLVLSDVAYPGWTATVNGRSAVVHRTDYVLRGVVVPAGESVVKLKYQPASLYAGAAVSVAAALAVAAVLWRGRRPRIIEEQL